MGKDQLIQQWLEKPEDGSIRFALADCCKEMGDEGLARELMKDGSLYVDGGEIGWQSVYGRGFVEAKMPLAFLDRPVRCSCGHGGFVKGTGKGFYCYMCNVTHSIHLTWAPPTGSQESNT